MLLGVLQFSRPQAVDSLSVTEAYHQLVGPKGLVNAETEQISRPKTTCTITRLTREVKDNRQT
jgi:hypothetical protein